MDIKTKQLAAGLAGMLALGGLGAGLVVAGFSGSGQPATVRIQPAAAQTPATPATPAASDAPTGSTAPAAEPAGPDTDSIQEGDQTSPDDPNEANEANEKEGTEKEGAEEPGDENLPGGGHADPEGQTADHQFEGVE